MADCRSRLFLCLALFLSASPEARADVLIGDASPLTGPISWVGAHYLLGTELAVDDLNARGGVLGEQVQLISVDDACDAEQAVVAAQKLIGDGVAFVGHVCSGAAIAAAPFYEAAGVMMISGSATNRSLPRPRQRVPRRRSRRSAGHHRRRLPRRALGG